MSFYTDQNRRMDNLTKEGTLDRGNIRDCGCKILYYPEHIEYCPLHASAPALTAEVAELKRQLAEIGELLKTASRQYSTVLQSNNDLRKQLSKARDAALVEVKEILLSKKLMETGQLAAIRLIVLPQPDLTPAEIQGGQEIHRLRQGKEKG